MRLPDVYSKIVFKQKRFIKRIASLPKTFWRKLWALPLIILFCILQVTILDSFRIFGIKPDLVLVVAVILSFSFGGIWAIFFSLFAGIMKDLFLPGVFGVNVWLFVLWSYFIVRLSRKITLDNKLVYMVVIFVVVFMQGVFNRLLFVFSDRFIPLGIFFQIAFLESLYSAAISPLVFKCVRIFLRDEFIE